MKSLKRISLLLREDQYKKIVDKQVNLSGLVRDLVDDHFSDFKITLSLTEETHELYQKIIANTGGSDEDLEAYFKEALHQYLKQRIKEMQKMEKDCF